MRSKEYFESVRCEVKAIDEARDMLERMKSIESMRAQGCQGDHVMSSLNDPMDSVARRIDFEHRLEQRIIFASDEVDRACEVLYGSSGNGGLAKAKGFRYADAICMYYCQGEAWNDIAGVMLSSPKWCRELCNAGFAFIDAYGMASLRES